MNRKDAKDAKEMQKKERSATENTEGFFEITGIPSRGVIHKERKGSAKVKYMKERAHNSATHALWISSAFICVHRR